MKKSRNSWRHVFVVLAVISGTAALAAIAARAPTRDLDFSSNLTYYFILVLLAWACQFSARAIVERASFLSGTRSITRFFLAMFLGLLIFGPLSEAADLVAGFSRYADAKLGEMGPRLVSFWESLLIEYQRAAIPNVMVAVLVDLVYFRTLIVNEGSGQPEDTGVGSAPASVSLPPKTETPVQPVQPGQPLVVRKAGLPASARLLVLEAQQHYVMVRTDQGDKLVHHRFGDALVELEHLDGLQVHRSYWVAREAVDHVEKSGRSLTIILKDKSNISVSRNRQSAVLRANWQLREAY